MKWAALVSPAQRPAILNEKHKDFIRPLRWIPRSWTAFLGNPPRKIAGNAEELLSWCPTCVENRKRVGMTGSNPYCTVPKRYPKPIPDPGQWWLGLPLYFAMTTKGGWHFRIGFRWDDVDGYYALSFTIKRYKN